MYFTQIFMDNAPLWMEVKLQHFLDPCFHVLLPFLKALCSLHRTGCFCETDMESYFVRQPTSSFVPKCHVAVFRRVRLKCLIFPYPHHPFFANCNWALSLPGTQCLMHDCTAINTLLHKPCLQFYCKVIIIVFLPAVTGFHRSTKRQCLLIETIMSMQ